MVRSGPDRGESAAAATTLRSDLDRLIICDCFRNVLCQNEELYLECHDAQRPRQDSRSATATLRRCPSAPLQGYYKSDE